MGVSEVCPGSRGFALTILLRSSCGILSRAGLESLRDWSCGDELPVGSDREVGMIEESRLVSRKKKDSKRRIVTHLVRV
jgi:hypothetical protein